MTPWPPRSLVVVEPHADDAFLSLGTTLERLIASGTAVAIVTVYTDSFKSRGRDGEAERYAAAIGARWVGCAHMSIGGGVKAAWAAAPLSPPTVHGRIPAADVVCWPFGIQHPEHRSVAALAPADAWRYLDLPYYAKRKNAAETARVVHGFVEVRVQEAALDKWRHIPLFRSQSKYFFFNPGARLARHAERLWMPQP